MLLLREDLSPDPRGCRLRVIACVRFENVTHSSVSDEDLPRAGRPAGRMEGQRAGLDRASVGRRRAMSSNVEATPEGPLADRFATLWQAGGPPPDVFSFLKAYPDATPHQRLGVLLVDQRQRWGRGAGLPVEAYLHGAPEIAGD